MDLSFKHKDKAWNMDGKTGGQTEQAWFLPEELGRGTVTLVQLRPGFQICIADYSVWHPMSIELDCPGPLVGFGFYISGRTRSRIRGVDGDIQSSAGQSPLYFDPHPSGTMEEPGNSIRRSVALLLSPECFAALLQDELDRLPRPFPPVSADSRNGWYGHVGKITTMMLPVLEQITNCPLQGMTRRLYLEGKAVELIALRLEQLVSEAAPPLGRKGQGQLTGADLERVRAAADLLVKDMENPPSLFTLARAVGISHGKLNRGFRQAFGTTAFGYLRERRLDQARQVLETRQMNVTQAAMNVGYNSLPSFSRAFYQRFGILPIECMNSGKNRT